MDFPRQPIRRGVACTPKPSATRSVNVSRAEKTLPVKRVVKIDGYEYSEENILGYGYSSKVYLGRSI